MAAKQKFYVDTRIVGVSFENADGTSRQEGLANIQEGTVLRLKREPRNKFDKNAVAVMTGNRQLGYLPRKEVAEMVSPMLKKKIKVDCVCISTGTAPNGLIGATVRLTWLG